jgi:hypothetical protein
MTAEVLESTASTGNSDGVPDAATSMIGKTVLKPPIVIARVSSARSDGLTIHT